MKKALYLLPFLLLPALLMAGVFQGTGFKYPGAMMPHSANYRLNNQVLSSYHDSDLVPDTRANMFYNPIYHTRIEAMNLDLYDSGLGEWSDTMMSVIYSYNAAGMVESSAMYAYFGGFKYLGYKHTSEYDSQNRLIRFFAYSEAGGGFRYLQPESRMHIIYGAGTTFEIYNWEADQGNPYSKATFQYDAQGRIIEQYSYSSADSVNWVQDGKTETTYHPQDTLTGAEFISYISHDLPVMLITDFFELPGKKLQELDYTWFNGSWAYQSRILCSYDEQVRKLSFEEQSYTGVDWRPDHRDLFYYDANGNLDYVNTEHYYGEDGFVNEGRIDYTWETYTSNTDLVQGPVSGLSLKAYPVPFAGELNILAESKSAAPLSVGIYNQRGQVVKELSGLAGSNLSWDGRDQSGKACSSGIYFLRATQGSSTATAKIVKLQ